MSNDERVIEIKLDFRPEAAISGAVLIQTELSTFLTFNAVALMPSGWYGNVGTALIKFENCWWTQFGYPNDEALPGHTLYEKGLGDYGYGVFEVLNSSWIERLEQQNRARFPNFEIKPLRHFIFTFHDSTFECLARDFTAEIMDEPYEQTLVRITKQVLAE